jgi:hydrogenase expression/formation protein HypE
MGKLTNKQLKKLIGCVRKDDRVLIPPMIGYDAGVHLLDDKYIVVATDPCTGVPESWFGWLLINYAASDIALFGAKPEFCTINLLGPIKTKPAVFQKIMAQTCKAANELGVAIVRGHTGMYNSLNDLLGVCTMYGTVKPERLVTPGNARVGDLIFCTKQLGLEIVINFSLNYPILAQELFGAKQQKTFANNIKMQSCFREALDLAEIGGVHAMHDSTEGGFMVALNELAEASKVGFRVEWNNLPFSEEILALKNHFKLSDDQILSMSSTGTILAAVDPQMQDEVKTVLDKNKLSVCFLGEFTACKKRVLIRNGKATPFPQIADDPYTKIMSVE